MGCSQKFRKQESKQPDGCFSPRHTCSIKQSGNLQLFIQISFLWMLSQKGSIVQKNLLENNIWQIFRLSCNITFDGKFQALWLPNSRDGYVELPM